VASELDFCGIWGDKGNRINGTYEIYRKFDPHRPYQNFLFFNEIKILGGNKGALSHV